MVQANCPNCGNTVPFHSEFSTHAVCGACNSLIVRQDSGVENLGKIAELQQDGSPLRVGVHGEYGGKNFQIVGRIQLKYEHGYWNEWYLFYSDGRSGWLGEAMGEYFVSFAVDAGTALPPLAKLALGDSLGLGDEVFVVTGSTVNQLSSYEGEIPFLVDSRHSFAAFDLRSSSGKAATIDYSDNPPTLFLGEYKPFQYFKFTGLRQEGESPDPGSGVRTPAASTAVEDFNCPTCGAPHSVAGGVQSKLLVCEYCGSAVDISTSSLNVIWREERMRQELAGVTEIELGAKAQVEGLGYTMIGYLKKSVTYEGVKYPWTEYLLYNRTNGYRWLVESDGHYTLMKSIEDVPTNHRGSPVGRPGPETIRYQGKDYRHFQTSTATVDAIAGEFYWRVRLGESALNFDYVAPPLTLSMEASQNSFAWSQGVYKTPDEIGSMFGLEKRLPLPVGVAAAQPNPHADQAQSVWKVFWIASLLGLFLLVTGVLSGSGETVFQTKGESYKTFRDNPKKTSPPFVIKGHGNIAFEFSAQPRDRWVYLDAELENVQSKKKYRAGTTLEQFSSKKRLNDTVRVSGVPSGEYTLTWWVKSGTTTTTAETVDNKQKSEDVTYSITLKRGVRVWGWWFLLLILLLPVPVMLTSRRSSFETRRWYNSDYG